MVIWVLILKNWLIVTSVAPVYGHRGTRFISFSLEEGSSLPDLIITDGGKGQMEVVREVIEEYYKESDLHEFIRNNFDENEIKRQAREDKLSESYPLPKE